jgi:osmotically inducible protein OsmC
MPTRKASAVWEGGLREGRGSLKGESGSLDGAYNFGSRFADGAGTNPEELLAAAEAGCFSMALAAGLERNGTPAERVETQAACTVEKVGDGFAITTIRLRTTARVPGIDRETFLDMANETKRTCVVSRALSSVEIQLEAELES